MSQFKMLGNISAGLVVVASCASFALVGCSDSDSMTKTTAQSHIESAKAAAEAEAAEEAYAKTKLAQAEESKPAKPATRGVASVKAKKKAAADSIFLVQVGTFKVEENAKNVVAKLKAAGLPAFQKKIERPNGVVLYAVRIEPTPNRTEAEKFASSVKAATGEPSLILSVGR